ncbi:hypothetical protein [Acidisoma sp. C75]
MRRATLVSVVLHFLLLAALIISLPSSKPPEAPDLTAVSVDFVGPASQVRQSDVTGKTAAPQKTQATTNAPQASQAPTPQPLSDAPPPPPPPPPPPSETPANQPPVPTPPPPAPAPPQPQAPATPPPPAQTPTPPAPTTAPAPQTTPSPSAEPLPPPPPPAPTPPQPQQPAKPLVKPTPPKPTPPKQPTTPQTPATPTPPSKTTTPAPPSPQTTAEATPALPMPPPPAPPAPPAPVSPTTQPNPTQNPAALSQSVLNTLDKLRSLNQKQQKPTSRYNPAQGGAPDAGGQRVGDSTSLLTAAQRGEIGKKIEGCWFIDGGAPNVQQLSVILQVKTRPGGEVYDARVAPQDQARVNANPVLQAFAMRAINAAENAQCNPLPLPASLSNAPQTFTIRFKP